jgi:hypothetical protein
MSREQEQWVRVYSTTEPHKIGIAKALLEEQKIPSFEVNKKDSAYVALGEIELYVRAEDKIMAGLILQKDAL